MSGAKATADPGSAQHRWARLDQDTNKPQQLPRGATGKPPPKAGNEHPRSVVLSAPTGPGLAVASAPPDKPQTLQQLPQAADLDIDLRADVRDRAIDVGRGLTPPQQGRPRRASYQQIGVWSMAAAVIAAVAVFAIGRNDGASKTSAATVVSAPSARGMAAVPVSTSATSEQTQAAQLPTDVVTTPAQALQPSASGGSAQSMTGTQAVISGLGLPPPVTDRASDTVEHSAVDKADGSTHRPVPGERQSRARAQGQNANNQAAFHDREEVLRWRQEHLDRIRRDLESLHRVQAPDESPPPRESPRPEAVQQAPAPRQD
jgi:hypothetical protein